MDATEEKPIENGMQLGSFQKDFITELFLDSDSVSTMNRLVVAIANVVHENNENIVAFNEAYKHELSNVADDHERTHSPLALNHIDCYENFSTLYKYEEDFIARFKMKKSTIKALINFLKENVKSTSSEITLDKKVHIFLWLLTNDSSFHEVGLIFGLPKTSVSYIFHEMAALLAEHRYHFINWSTLEEQHVTSIKVNSRFKFPNCVGFIDTCQFNVGSKRKKKGNMDVVLLQGVCDESLMFIDIYIGPIGQTKKYKVFKESPISLELKNFVDFENHILGDSEYKLKMNLITPYSSEELLTSEEMKFNDVHWKARSYICNAFEKLKERFKKLSHIDIAKPETINSIILSACVLHNFILLHEGTEIKEELILCDDGVTIDKDIVTTAMEKRQFLCNYINYIDMENNALL